MLSVFGSGIWENRITSFQILKMKWLRSIFENKNGAAPISCSTLYLKISREHKIPIVYQNHQDLKPLLETHNRGPTRCWGTPPPRRRKCRRRMRRPWPRLLPRRSSPTCSGRSRSSAGQEQVEQLRSRWAPTVEQLGGTASGGALGDGCRAAR
jgi:hypothetical protein